MVTYNTRPRSTETLSMTASRLRMPITIVLARRTLSRWALKVPPTLAFGDKGLKPSPGKPRIPGGATIEYEVLFETFPGREADILEVTGGEGV
eukprot:751472-Hanusia_phi.AAC.5